MKFSRKILIFAFIVLPVLLVTAYSYWHIKKDTVNRVYEERRSLASLSASVLKEKFDRLKDISLSFSTRPVLCRYVDGQKWNDAISVMKQVPVDFPYITHVLITDTAGTLMADVPSSPALKGKNYAQQDWYKGLTKNWRPYLSEVYKRSTTPRNIVTALALPVKDEAGKIRGILVLQVDISELLEWSKEVSIGNSGFVYVVDQNGHIAINPQYAETDSVIDYSSVPVVQKALSGQKNVEILYNPIAKENRLTAYEQIPGYGWAVIVQQEATAALSGNSSLRVLFILYAVIILFALVSAYFITREMGRRKKTEENLLQTTSRLSLATRAGGVGIWEWDIVNNKLSWDDQMYRLYGITAAMFSGAYEAWVQGLHPEDIERGNNEIQAAIRGEKEFDTEFRVVWPDSSIHYIRGIANVERDAGGKALRMIGTNWDITESKQAEGTLQNTLKEVSDYKFALDESAIVAITDPKGIINYVNDNFCKISGYSREELIGQDHRIISSGFHPKEFIRDLWVTIANGKIWRGDLKNRAKDGTYYWVDTTIIPFLNNQGKPYQYVAIRAEITQRKKAEEQLLRVNQELEAFTYSVSHDLRAPLRGIVGFTSILEEDYSSKLDDEARRITSVIKNSTTKMGHLIDDLLAFSRMGRQEIIKTGIHTSVMVKEMIAELNRQHKGHPVEWVVHPLPDVKGDINLIRQVWVNFISNAVKYSGKNEKPCIEIGSFTKDGQTVFFVKDNGVGFDKQYGDKLFKVFQRLHSADEFEGTGVGLAIVEKIISKHGGKVWAEGEVNKGASFYFSLPTG